MPLTPEFSVERLKNPDTRAQTFEAIVRALSPKLYGQIRKIVQWHEDADDVLQNTYLKAWQAIDSFRGDCQISTWLFKIALNESLIHLSKQRDTKSLDDESSIMQRLESDPYFDGDETERQLQQAIATLPNKQRIVFNLRYFDEMKYEQISELLDTSVGALKASYHAAAKKIQQYFERND